MNPPAPGRVIALGLWAGWIAALLFGRIVPVSFAVHPPPDGIFSACALAGYPKQQDWFRYGLGLVAGPLGALGASLGFRVLRARGFAGRWRRGGLEAGLGTGLVATLCAFLNADAGPAVALLLLPVAAALPWLDRRWYAEDQLIAEQHVLVGRIGWRWNLPLIAVFSFFWLFDSCVLLRSVDGFHEGPRLLYLQGFLAGDLPGADVRIEYGPLMVHALWWWSRVAGATFESYRWWFLACQWLGLALMLVSLRRVTRSPVAIGAAAIAILCLSSAASVQFGVPNALRMGLPMAVLAFADRAVIAGALLATATLFSPEFGAAAALGWGAGSLGARRPVGDWLVCAATAVVTGAGWMALMFGARWPEGVGRLLDGGYGAARLRGHGVTPLPDVPWLSSFAGVSRDLGDWGIQACVWGPGLLATGTLMWLVLRRHRDPGARTAWSVFVLLVSIPVIARPAGQQVNLAPAAAVLAALGIEAGLRVSRRTALGGAALLVLLGINAVAPVAGPLASKGLGCLPSLRTASPAPPGLERLGRIAPGEARLRELARMVEAVRRRCPRGGRVYVAAPRYAHLPFLAGRSAFGAIPLTTLAVTAADRAATVAALGRDRPPVALVTADGLEAPWALEHAEEARVIARDYRRVEVIGDLEIHVRRR